MGFELRVCSSGKFEAFVVSLPLAALRFRGLAESLILLTLGNRTQGTEPEGEG
jgi:hypothetical protein